MKHTQKISTISFPFCSSNYLHRGIVRGPKPVTLRIKDLKPFNHVQEVFVAKITKMIEHRNEGGKEVLSGWFTPEQMKSELKWSTTLDCIPSA